MDAAFRPIEDLPKALECGVSFDPAKTVLGRVEQIVDLVGVGTVQARLHAAELHDGVFVFFRAAAEPEVAFARTPREKRLAETGDFFSPAAPSALLIEAGQPVITCVNDNQ